MLDDPSRAPADAAGTGPGEAEMRQALERVLARPPFSRSKRLSVFLGYIVEETLQGRAEAISGYAIGVDVFGKPEDFDPAIDSIVRVEAGRLRRRLAEYYHGDGVDDPVEISLPKGSYVPMFTVKAKPDLASRPAAGPHHLGPSIAILPFDNFGGDPGDQFFADGLTEETIANLARFKDLFVFSRSTTAKYAREGADIGQLREALGVELVLESSLRKSSDLVRVTVQLIDAATQGHIFAEKFERPCTPGGIFQIQDEVALLVAGRVADRYGPLGRYVARASRAGQPRRWETYLWIMRFYDYYARHDAALHLEVREGLEAALERDSDSSDGCAALAAVYLDEYRFHFNERPRFPALDRALETALRSVTYDPDNAMAYQFLAVTTYHRRELSDFEIAAQRALELNPGHADMLADVGHCYALAGDWDRGLALLRRALELSPVHPGWYHHAPAMRLMLDDEPEAALHEMRKGALPGFYWHHAFCAAMLAWAGREADAALEVEALLAAYPDFAQRALDECAIWTSNAELVDKLSEGWRRAGLALS